MTEAIQKINYPSNETAEYEYAFGALSAAQVKTHDLPNSLFEYGKAKKIVVKVSGSGPMIGNAGIGRILLPSGGTYFVHTGTEFSFMSGGSELESYEFASTGSKTFSSTFYIARVA